MTLRTTLVHAMLGGIAVFGLAASSVAIAAPLKVDAAKSTVGAVFKQLNVPVEAKFKKFVAQIDFDSAKPDAAKASVDIDIASFDLARLSTTRKC